MEYFSFPIFLHKHITGLFAPELYSVTPQSDRGKVRLQGVDVEHLVLEDEGHGFSKKENEIKVYRRILEFLERHREHGDGTVV